MQIQKKLFPKDLRRSPKFMLVVLTTGGRRKNLRPAFLLLKIEKKV